jgi:zinc protease
VPLSVLATVLCLALPIAAVISRPAAAAKPDVKAPSTTSQAFPFPVKEKTLPNGLRVYVVAYDSPGLVAYYSIVRTGSRNEVEPGKSGFAHFFEHMMFRGTEHYSQDAYNAVIKEMGADSNAFTSDDLTVYHILAGKTALPRIVEIEADRFQHLQYKEPDFQKEARAVLGEYNKNASNPMEKMAETLYDNAYTTHTYKHTTMGFLKDIENMPNQFGYSRQFFDRYYRPDTVTLLVLGDVDAEMVFGLVEKEYGPWARGPARPPVPPEPPQKKGKQVDLTWKGATLPMLMVGYHVPGFSTTNVDLPALDVLSELLFAERAPLYKKLVITEQKVEMLAGSADPHVDPNLFTIMSRIKKPADIAYVQSAIEDEIGRLARDGVDDRTLAEVLSHVKYAFAGQLSTADKTAYTASSFLALTGDLGSINAYFALYDKVTVADVKRVAAKTFTTANRSVVTMKANKQ